MRFADRDTLDVAFADLFERSPWLQEPLAYLYGQAKRCIGAELLLPPVILVGPPGCGKTTMVGDLGRAIGLPRRRVEMAAATAVFDVTGSEATWSSSMQGVPAALVTDGREAGGFVVFDEVDKAGRSSQRGGDPVEAMLVLLERGTAKTFRCPFLRTEIDLSGINYLLTANDADRIPQPLKDRCVMFKVRLPDFREARDVIIREDSEVVLDKEAVIEMAQAIARGRLSLRGMKRVIEEAIIKRNLRGLN